MDWGREVREGSRRMTITKRRICAYENVIRKPFILQIN